MGAQVALRIVNDTDEAVVVQVHGKMGLVSTASLPEGHQWEPKLARLMPHDLVAIDMTGLRFVLITSYLY